MNMNYYKWLGERLKYHRLLKGMTLEQVGERVSLTKKQIQNYETGSSKISVPLFIQFCDIYGINPNDLMNESIKEFK